MRVNIHHAWRDIAAVRVDHARAFRRLQSLADGGDTTVLDQNVGVFQLAADAVKHGRAGDQGDAGRNGLICARKRVGLIADDVDIAAGS